MHISINRKAILLVSVLAIMSCQDMAAQRKDDMKSAKKEAKSLAKDGWRTAPGDPSLSEQIAVGFYYQEAVGEWVVGEASAVGDVYDVAKGNALMSAKQAIAKRLEETVSVEGTSVVANSQTADGDTISSASVNKKIRSRFAAAIGRPKVLLECYRDKSQGKVEVFLRIAIPLSRAEKVYRDALNVESRSSD